jgi:hypothetical protein
LTVNLFVDSGDSLPAAYLVVPEKVRPDVSSRLL